MTIQKATKALPLLFLLCLASYTLDAAKVVHESDLSLFLNAPQTNVLDYTATHAKKKIDHTVDFQELNDENITDDLDTLCFKAKDNSILLVAILSNQPPRKKANNLKPKDDQKQVEEEGQGHLVPTPINIEEVGAKGVYKKYVLDARGLLNQKARNSAQKLGYHIVQTQPAHIVVALMQWVTKSKEKCIYDIAIGIPVCEKCQYLLTLMGCTTHVKSHKKGCQAKSFPWPMPSLAMEYLNGAILNSGQPLEMTQTLLQQLLGISETSYNTLKDELSKTNIKINKLQIALKVKEKALVEGETAKRLVKQLTEQLSTKNNEINQIKLELNNKNNLMNALSNKKREIEDELSKTQTKLNNKENLLNETQINLENKNNRIEEIEDELNKTQTKLNNKENLLNETQLKLENKNHRIGEIEDELNNRDNEVRQLTDQLGSKKNELNGTKLKLKNNEELLAQLRNDKNNEIRQLNDQLRQKENQFKHELKKKEKELSDAQQLVKQLLDNKKSQNNMQSKPQLSKKKYKGKSLPQDLSGQNLSGYDFTGCRFTYTNLAYTDLTNVILTNTTCDYQEAFEDNSIKNKLKVSDWYRNNLPEDLKSIAEVYPKLNNNTHKAKLLAIAAGLAWLPFYESTEFYIKVTYWSCELVKLKQALGLVLFGYRYGYGSQLVCSLQSDLEYDANNYCWTSQYPQDKVNIDDKAPHANFDTYLKDFTCGLTKYQCKSKYSDGFDWYKEGIIKNIEGLKATYPHIKEKKLQKEARDIAHALSKSYKSQQMVFLNHYLFSQNRLIRLKKSVGSGVKNKVYYRKGNAFVRTKLKVGIL